MEKEQAKKQAKIWDKKKSFIALYDEDDEWLITTFNTVADMLKYKGLEITPKNKAHLTQQIYYILKNQHGYTTMFGEPRYIHIIKDNEEEETSSKGGTEFMKRFVKITATRAFRVMVDSQDQSIDASDVNAINIQNRLKSMNTWVDTLVTIKKGTGWYPGVIAEWKSVKTLEANGLISIGAKSDDCDDQEVVKMVEAFETAQKNYDNQRKQVKEQAEAVKANIKANIQAGAQAGMPQQF